MKELKEQRNTQAQQTQYMKYTSRAGGAREFVLIAVFLLVLAGLSCFAAGFLPEKDAYSEQILRWMGVRDETGEPVGGCIDIEEAWAIEETRTEAEEPLVTRMFHDNEILGYDRESRTFYCTLGNENGEDWPEMLLTVGAQEQASVAFIDDYTYDYCQDAVWEGYRYELIAYTESEYEYIGIVFTGMPIVTVHVDENAQIPHGTDVGADIHIAGGEKEIQYSRALIHERGAGVYHNIDKWSYRLEFRGFDLKGNDKRVERSVLGMEADSDWLLLGNCIDETAIKNHLCFQFWKEWDGEARNINELESRLVELFIDDSYMGIYQLMEYIDEEKELTLMGGNLKTDICARKISETNEGTRPIRNYVGELSHALELRYIPVGMSAEEAFDIFQTYEDLDMLYTRTLDDKTFAQLVEKHFDIERLLQFFLFQQAYCLTVDNVKNNVYLWALRQEDGTYRFSPSLWDMDISLYTNIAYGEDHLNETMNMIFRMLNLNVGGCQQRLWEIWNEKRSTILADDVLYERFYNVEEEINSTGAYLRESEKWRDGAVPLNLTRMRVEVVGRQSRVDQYLQNVWPQEETQDW